MRRLAWTTALFATLALSSACVHSARQSRAPDLSLEEAKALIGSGQVKELFQPHQGCVLLTMKNGTMHTFIQPYLDWVYYYVEQQGLLKSIQVSTE